jgi:hypothetical protein
MNTIYFTYVNIKVYNCNKLGDSNKAVLHKLPNNVVETIYISGLEV